MVLITHFILSILSCAFSFQGPGKDVIIDTGLGVCDLRHSLMEKGLISPPGGERECEVIVTHAHFDHSGGAHHFDKVWILQMLHIVKVNLK